MSTVVMDQRKKIHPHKFNLWVAIGSILMMFAGLTSAIVIHRNQAGWRDFEIPGVFWMSTVVMLLSSVTIWMAQRAFKARLMNRYRILMAATVGLGVLFLLLQYMGFKELWQKGINLKTSVSTSFLYVLVLLHGLHILGGVIAMVVMLLKAFGNKVRVYSQVPVEVMGTYWHFVDVLWVYLLFFLFMIK